MRRRWASIAGAGVLLAGPVHATLPPGYPYDSNSLASAWAQVEPTYRALSNLWAMVTERCYMAGTNYVPPPSIVETFWCFAGYRTNVIVPYVFNGTNSAHTNVYASSVPVTVTNCFTPFHYTYTTNGGGSGIGLPIVTSQYFDEIDRATEELYPFFVTTNAADPDGTLAGWWGQVMGKMTNYYPDSWHTTLPLESKAGIFHRHGIGATDRLTTNLFGWVTGGRALWTQRRPSTLVTNSMKNIVTLAQANGDYVFYASGFPTNIFAGEYRYRGDIQPHGGYTTTNSGYQFIRWWGGGANTGNLAGARWTIGRGSIGTGVNRRGQYFSPRYQRLPAGTNWVDAFGVAITGAVVTVTTNWVTGRTVRDLDYYGYGGYDYRAVWDLRPTVRYRRADTNLALATLGVDIYGKTAATNSYTGTRLWYPFAYYGDEQIAVNQEWTPLETPFLTAEMLTVTGAVALGDSVAVVWTNLVYYGPRNNRLLNQQIDERMAAVRPLRWTWGRTDPGGVSCASVVWTNWVTDRGGSNTVTVPYSIIGGPTWGEATTEVASRWYGSSNAPPVWGKMNGIPPTIRTAGYRGTWDTNQYYLAKAQKAASRVVVRDVWTGRPCAADIYLVGDKPEDVDAAYWDFYSEIPDLTYRAWARVESDITGSGELYGSPWGNVSPPSEDEWGTGPTADGAWYWRGYLISLPAVVIIKWEPTY